MAAVCPVAAAWAACTKPLPTQNQPAPRASVGPFFVRRAAFFDCRYCGVVCTCEARISEGVILSAAKDPGAAQLSRAASEALQPPMDSTLVAGAVSRSLYCLLLSCRRPVANPPQIRSKERGYKSSVQLRVLSKSKRKSVPRRKQCGFLIGRTQFHSVRQWQW